MRQLALSERVERAGPVSGALLRGGVSGGGGRSGGGPFVLLRSVRVKILRHHVHVLLARKVSRAGAKGRAKVLTGGMSMFFGCCMYG